jgi:hypothetical protein
MLRLDNVTFKLGETVGCLTRIVDTSRGSDDCSRNRVTLYFGSTVHDMSERELFELVDLLKMFADGK